WQHVLVAEGSLDVAIDAVGVATYDVAAVRLIVEEAGGTFTDRHGVPAHDRGTAISTNGLLHAEIIERLRG
ncbi:MAG: inositol monophosphatase family protein, partial [Ilumatobacteraceae bacterium]